MPYSIQSHINRTINHLVFFNPASVLDVGCGFGRWGFLSREFLDIMAGRVQKEEWQVRIDAVEAFGPYIMDHQRFLYNDIYTKDLRDCIDSLGSYDIIIAGDVIEHFPKEEALALFEKLYAKARLGILVSLPLGHSEQDAMFGNPYEEHKSEWELADFDAYPHVASTYSLHWGEYAAITFPRDCNQETLLRILIDDAESQWQIGNHEGVEKSVRWALDLDPENTEANMILATSLAIRKRAVPAIKSLEACLRTQPDHMSALQLIVRLQTALGRTDEAVSRLKDILANHNLSAENRQNIQKMLAQLNS